MFTGIITEIGRVTSIGRHVDRRLRISCARQADAIAIGASIACSGVCLTVVARGSDDAKNWFDVDVSTETCARTTLGTWAEGTKVNLEQALKVGDELGGHIVSGHVDGIGKIVSVRPEGDSHRVTIAAPKTLGRFIAEKGSVTVDGISLTVNMVEDVGDVTHFGVNIIPHTWQVTSLSDAGPGTSVNLEIDMLARYLARLTEAG